MIQFSLGHLQILAGKGVALHTVEAAVTRVTVTLGDCIPYRHAGRDAGMTTGRADRVRTDGVPTVCRALRRPPPATRPRCVLGYRLGL